MFLEFRSLAGLDGKPGPDVLGRWWLPRYYDGLYWIRYDTNAEVVKGLRVADYPQAVTTNINPNIVNERDNNRP